MVSTRQALSYESGRVDKLAVRIMFGQQCGEWFCMRRKDACCFAYKADSLPLPLCMLNDRICMSWAPLKTESYFLLQSVEKNTLSTAPPLFDTHLPPAQEWQELCKYIAMNWERKGVGMWPWTDRGHFFSPQKPPFWQKHDNLIIMLKEVCSNHGALPLLHDKTRQALQHFWNALS